MRKLLFIWLVITTSALAELPKLPAETPDPILIRARHKLADLRRIDQELNVGDGHTVDREAIALMYRGLFYHYVERGLHPSQMAWRDLELVFLTEMADSLYARTTERKRSNETLHSELKRVASDPLVRASDRFLRSRAEALQAESRSVAQKDLVDVRSCLAHPTAEMNLRFPDVEVFGFNGHTRVFSDLEKAQQHVQLRIRLFVQDVQDLLRESEHLREQSSLGLAQARRDLRNLALGLKSLVTKTACPSHCAVDWPEDFQSIKAEKTYSFLALSDGEFDHVFRESEKLKHVLFASLIIAPHLGAAKDLWQEFWRASGVEVECEVLLGVSTLLANES